MRRTFIARIEGRDLPIEVEEIGPSRYDVKLDGAAQSLDVRRLGRGRLSLLIDGRSHQASLIRSADDFDVLVSNRRFHFRLLPEERARRARSAAGDALHGHCDIQAAMPGKVVEVLVQVGDAVAAHQGLLIVEAMKMENEIRAPGAGKVKEIRVQPGQAVEAGEVLVVVE